MAKITVEGGDYRVIESLGYQHSAGVYAKQVQTEDGPRMAVKHRGGRWRWWTTLDRVSPLLEAAVRKHRDKAHNAD